MSDEQKKFIKKIKVKNKKLMHAKYFWWQKDFLKGKKIFPIHPKWR